MKSWEKALLLAGAGLLTYGLLKRSSTPDVRNFYAGKTAIVTGGANGIGLALVEQLRDLGAQVLAVDMNAKALEELAAKGVDTLLLDLASADGPVTVLEEALARMGSVDLLFNNAGILAAMPFWDMTDEQIERLISINFIMQIRMTRYFLPYMIRRGRGVIAYTGSLSAHVYAPSHSVYTGTKGGLNNFVHAVRRELPRNSGVQLTIIHPNITRTNLADREMFDKLSQIIDLQTPSEVALAFLKGVANGNKEVYVRAIDLGYKWAERLIPAYADYKFQSMLEMDEERRNSLQTLQDI